MSVRLEVDEDALEDQGWHHEETCPVLHWATAVQVLHEQAHPASATSYQNCFEQPCCDLDSP